jgi:hypothetical protein
MNRGTYARCFPDPVCIAGTLCLAIALAAILPGRRMQLLSHFKLLYVYILTLLLAVRPALLNICVNLLKLLCDLIKENQIRIVLEICSESSLSG